MDETTFKLMMGAASSSNGQMQWSTPGTYSFVVPQDVNYISALTIAPGQNGTLANGNQAGSTRGNGGRGGDLRYARRIYVSRGETLTVYIDTTVTRILRGSTILLQAFSNGATSTPLSANVGGGNGGLGGTTSAGGRAGGGGGAGGYSGDGGNGGAGDQGGGGPGDGKPGTGGAAAGGSWGENGVTSQGQGAGAGGGVGILGPGPSGTTASAPGSNGQAGSLPGTRNPTSSGGIGGQFGGGGGGATNLSGNVGTVGLGGSACARIIWGPGREYPSSNVGNV